MSNSLQTASQASHNNANKHPSSAIHPISEKKSPHIIRRIGDDGNYMTKKRIRTHHCLNFFAGWGALSLILTLLFSALAYLQGQTFSQFELIASGGNMISGYYTADLLRIEAAFCFVSGVIFIVLHLSGFIWLYENGRRVLVTILCAVLGTLSVVWFAFLLSLGIVEPLSFIAFTTMLLFWIFSLQAQKERKEVDLSV